MTNVDWRYVFVLLSALSGVSIITIAFLRPDLKKGRLSFGERFWLIPAKAYSLKRQVLTDSSAAWPDIPSVFPQRMRMYRLDRCGVLRRRCDPHLACDQLGRLRLRLGVSSGLDTSHRRTDIADILRCVSTIYGAW
jgi:hypothetical protein